MRASAIRYSSDIWNSFVAKIPSHGGKYTYTAKDNILTKGITTSGSEILSNFESPYDATVIKLLQQDMDLIGKVNLDEFGMGSSTTNSIFGPTFNPLFSSGNYIVGGSSGGSAASVAAKLCDFSLGTDTGGSIRLPASYCGLYGFKPSYGRISRWGVISYAQTLDTVGIISGDNDIIKQVFKLLDKFDPKDPTSLPEDVRTEIDRSVSIRNSIRQNKYVFGVPQELIVEELTSEVTTKLSNLIEYLIDQGHSVVPVSIPSITNSLSAYYTIATAEATSNLSRYDGIRYGKKSKDIVDSRTHGLGPEVQRRIVLGNYTISSDSGDHYSRANELRNTLVQQFNNIFYLPNHLLYETNEQDLTKCDFLISSTTISKPIKVQEFLKNEKDNLLEAYTNDILTVPMSLAGLPTITIPLDSTQGIQLFGQYGDDNKVLEIAGQLRDS